MDSTKPVDIPIAVLGTAEICLEANGKITQSVRAIFDTGAQINLITDECVRNLQLQTRVCNIEANGAGKKPLCTARKVVIANICRRNGRPVLSGVKFIVVPEITEDMPNIEICESFEGTIADEYLADPYYQTPGPVEILLGAGVWGSLMTGAITCGAYGLLAQLTELGWVIFGDSPMHTELTCHIMSVTTADDLEKALRRLWEVDEVFAPIDLTPDERFCEDNFAKTHYRDEKGRYVVKMPIKDGAEAQLGNSYNNAASRFRALERRFEREPELKAEYVEFMREYETLDHMRVASSPVPDGEPHYFIPHHAVKKKFRVVFDGSAPTSTGVSLNEIQLPGPKLQSDLYDIIIRFRLGKVAMSADVRKMFRQVRIDPEQWNMQRILWRESPEEPLKEYQLTVVTYGLTSSGYNAVKAMHQCAIDYEKQFPRTAHIIQNSFYMDDLLHSEATVAEAANAKSDLEYVLNMGGFELAKWTTNNSEILGSESQSELCLDKDETSVLGLNWFPGTDTIEFKFRVCENDAILTKRLIASLSAQFYDPMGYAIPFTSEAKRIMQNLWRIGITWDEPVTDEIANSWRAFYANLPVLKDVKIPRWIGMSPEASTQLHMFCDASNTAYGAVTYTRTMSKDGSIVTNLITAKGKLATLKSTTIPRLELAAAHLGAKLANKVASILSIAKEDIFYWTDSEIVLYWLRKFPAELKTYVGNRISEIQETSDVKAWSHVRSLDNPADCLSRGMAADKLLLHEIWWKGPSFLKKPEDLWPKWKCAKLTPEERKEADDERRKKLSTMASTVSLLTTSGQSGQGEIDVLSNRAKMSKALRITAYVQRFCAILYERVKAKNGANPKEATANVHMIKRKRTAKTTPTKSAKKQKPNEMRKPPKVLTEHDLRIKSLISMIKPITATEYSKALAYWIKYTQRNEFGDEIKAISKGEPVHKGSRIAKFVPFIDDDGIVRMRGRLEHSSMSYDEKHPILLPGSATLSRRLIEDAHQKTLHGQAQVCLQYLREKYWITDARSILRNWIKHCPKCVRFNQRMATQLMADLPSTRVQISRPFEHCGVDYAGPFKIEAYRGRGTKVELSAYVAIFVCFTTKAVHLELVGNLSAKAFLAAFDRFFIRRQHVKHMYSDNGTNFVAANKELRAAIETWNSSEVINYLSAKNIEWHFNTPLASHQGGLWERAVQSMKYHFRRIMAEHVLTFEEMYTVLVRIEAADNIER